jgi:hypothetical protein
MEKYNITDFVNLKCKERNHYSNNCLLCSAAGCFEYETARACEDVKLWAQSGLFIQLKDQLCQHRTQYNTLLHM